MVKVPPPNSHNPIGKGGKKKSRRPKGDNQNKRELMYKDEETEYAEVTKMLGTVCYLFFISREWKIVGTMRRWRSKIVYNSREIP